MGNLCQTRCKWKIIGLRLYKGNKEKRNLLFHPNLTSTRFHATYILFLYFFCLWKLSSSILNVFFFFFGGCVCVFVEHEHGGFHFCLCVFLWLFVFHVSCACVFDYFLFMFGVPLTFVVFSFCTMFNFYICLHVFLYLFLACGSFCF
jgi:hypothetical protein